MTNKIITAHYLLKNKKPTFQCFYWNTYIDLFQVYSEASEGVIWKWCL